MEKKEFVSELQKLNANQSIGMVQITEENKEYCAFNAISDIQAGMFWDDHISPKTSIFADYFMNYKSDKVYFITFTNDVSGDSFTTIVNEDDFEKLLKTFEENQD